MHGPLGFGILWSDATSSSRSTSEARAKLYELSRFREWRRDTLYVAYLDDFGHVGPFVSRTDPAHKTNPVFGLGGIVLPYSSVRDFATWFYKRKCELLAFEIERSGVHPSQWEKKGAALLTTRNIHQYRQLRLTINRILNRIESVGGFVYYKGIVKHRAPEDSSAKRLYMSVLRKAIQGLDRHCLTEDAEFLLVLDECSGPEFHADVTIRQAGLTMFGKDYCSRLVEPPFSVSSHLYQTLQCADWICGLLGRLEAYKAEPAEFSEFEWAARYFDDRLKRVSKHSSVRSKQRGLQYQAQYATPQSARPAVSASLSEARAYANGNGVEIITVEIRETL